MVLVDTLVWIDHFRRRDDTLVGLLGQSLVCHHPMVVGELALGSIANRADVLSLLASLPAVTEATHAEVLAFVETQRLYTTGLSLVDAHLLAAVRLTPGTTLWTRDRRLRTVAVAQRVAYTAG